MQQANNRYRIPKLTSTRLISGNIRIQYNTVNNEHILFSMKWH